MKVDFLLLQFKKTTNVTMGNTELIYSFYMEKHGSQSCFWDENSVEFDKDEERKVAGISLG
jgi:hypothetical protein